MSVQMFTQGQKHTIAAELKAGATVKDTARRWNCSVDTIRRIRKEIEKFAASKPVVQDVGATSPLATAIAVIQKKAEVHKIDVAIKVEKPKAELIWTMGANFINIIQDGVPYVANSSHPNFEKARAAIFEGRVEDAFDLINVKAGITKYTQGKIRIENEEVFYGDLKINTGLTKRIIEAMGEGKDFKHLVNFFENLMLNPSRRAVHELFGFLEHNDIELTDDGHFLAWKRVNENYTDMYTGLIDNTPGKIVEVDRNQVDEDPNRTCSHGLHIAAKSYLPAYGGGRGVIIQCKIHPRDVVAVPTDYNNAKMRCCRYEVLKDVTEGFSHY